MSSSRVVHSGGDSTLGDILERVLDKGVVIAGDISIAIADVELLTIKIRLVVASVDKAMEMGIDWWKNDPALSSKAYKKQEENNLGKDRIKKIETQEDRMDVKPKKIEVKTGEDRTRGNAQKIEIKTGEDW